MGLVHGGDGWDAPDPRLAKWIEDHRRRALDSYRANPLLIGEHAGQEDSFRTGGYAERQVLELVQNAADALARSGGRGRVEIRLVGGVLYCANEGSAFAAEGLEAICHAYLSGKRGEDIGRFGLGFKSVLGVTDSPAIFSKSVSFGFGARESRELLEPIAPGLPAYPVLRIPQQRDPAKDFGADPVLAELAQWATTVVRLPLVQAADRLERDLYEFPSGFLLFAPSVARLVLGASAASTVELRCDELGDHRYRVVDALGQSRDWLVWHQTHRPSEQALDDVSRAIGRAEVTVSYAAPLDDVQETGRFWAFFPLTDETSVRGILNAPWNVSDDRTYLHEGAFNEELLDVAAELVVNALPSLTTATDPGRHLDYLPARGRESENFADRRLTVTVPELAAGVACLPDGDGVLRRPHELNYLNLDAKVEYETITAWSGSPGRPVDYPHPTCYRSRVRRARLRRLVRGEVDRPAATEVSVVKWLEALVRNGRDEECVAALRVYQAMDDPSTRSYARSASVLPDSEGRMWSLGDTAHLFLRGNPLSEAAGIRVVRPSFLDLPVAEERRPDGSLFRVIPGVETMLRQLGFTDIDAASELRSLATTAANRWGGIEWLEFWKLVAETTLQEAREILLGHLLEGATLKVRCRDGTWQHVGTVVVEGLVHPAKGGLILDDVFHEDHLDVLRAVGVSDRPRVSRAVTVDMTLLEYRRREREEYLRELPPRGRPDASVLVFEEKEGPGPLYVLRRFADIRDDESRLLWSEALLAFDGPAQWTLAPLRGRQLPKRAILAPHLWAVENYGLVETTWGPREVRSALHPKAMDVASFLPVATSLGAETLPALLDPGRIPVDLWREFLARTPDDGDAALLGSLLHHALGALPRGEIPDVVPAARGGSFACVRPSELLLAAGDEEGRALRARNLPFVVVDEGAAAELVDAWDCRRASDSLQVDIVPENADEPVPVLDRYRRLRDYGDGQLDAIDLVTCGGLTRVVTTAAGAESEPIDFAITGNTVYATLILDEEDLLGRIGQGFGLDLDDRAIERALHEADTERVQQAVAQCRAETDPAAKLLALLPVSALAAVVPAGLLDLAGAADGATDDHQVAELVLHVHGYTTLVKLRHELEGRGYPVPSQWSGSGPAVAFIRSLGFPTEYAGERGALREPELTVLGPPRLNRLHHYQEQLAAEIRALARRSDDPQRALLFLPTGAGKTRVTVEALVRSFNAGELDGPVLWIAQSDELCEQAVQTWITVWREFGGEPLRLGRLWDRNEVGATDNTASVVVATDAKLDVVRGRDEYEWLRQAGIVVVDEAHGATAAGITATLRWLGIDQHRTERPFLGLTATPFKGTGEEANRRLAGRFGGRVLNVLGDDPYAELQRLGVLARIEHRVLQGSAYELEASERASFDRFKDIPSSVLDRIGNDRERTVRLVNDISSLPANWPVLVFTSSVLGAQTLSVLLRMREVTSSAVSGVTPTSERRRAIDEFRNGKVQVLTNCNVLTQGFDAPEVRALYIARPTFSPNAYIQMVGRGLRGPANGGKEECLIVNVEDTFDVFGDQLAYREFDYLWRHQGRSPS